MTRRARVIPKDEFQKLLAKNQTVIDAHAEAQVILQAAKVEAEAMKQRAVEEAEAEGQIKADQIVDAARVQVEAHLAALEAEVSQLIGETVAGIVGQIDRPLAIKAATQTALAILSEHKLAKLRVAPGVFDVVSDAVETAPDGSAEVLSVVRDDALAGDRVVLSSDRGHVEIGLSQQVEAATAPWREDGA